MWCSWRAGRNPPDRGNADSSTPPTRWELPEASKQDFFNNASDANPPTVEAA